MPTRLYALEGHGRSRLKITWKGAWKNLSIYLDKDLIGTVPTREDLVSGQEFVLPDGSHLRLQLLSGYLTRDLRIMRDGRPLPDSIRKLTSTFGEAYGIVFLIGGLNLLLGIVGTLFPIAFLQQMDLSLPSIVFGVVYLVLALFARRRSMVALLAAIILFSVMTLVSLVGLLVQGASYGVIGLIVRMYLIWLMIQGMGAIKLLESEEQANRQQASLQQPIQPQPEA